MFTGDSFLVQYVKIMGNNFTQCTRGSMSFVVANSTHPIVVLSA